MHLVIKNLMIMDKMITDLIRILIISNAKNVIRNVLKSKSAKHETVLQHKKKTVKKPESAVILPAVLLVPQYVPAQQHY